MEYHICCSTDENYAQHCCVMLCSLFENNKGNHFVIHILISDLSDDTKSKLRSVVEHYASACVFHKVDESKLDGVQFREENPLSIATYYRILLSSIIDNSISKILYLDSDIVVANNIMSIFNLDIENYALAAVEDMPITNERRMRFSLPYDAKYFNAGVMFINLDYWRKNKSEIELLEFAKKERVIYDYDQGALNAVFRSQWFALPRNWNKLNMHPSYCFSFVDWRDRYEFCKHANIIHYTVFKPWLNFPFIPYKRFYYQYLHLTPWKNAKPEKLKNYRMVFFNIYFCLVEPFLKHCHLQFLCYPALLRRRHKYNAILRHQSN
jgi:lipopolysaccharide biosynthesis glycosyltransferase